MLPSIERHARTALRRLSGEAREDAHGEVVANCMCAYLRLHQRAELQRAYASVLVRYAVAMYFRGRRVGTTQNSRDVYSSTSRTGSQSTIRLIGTPGERHAVWMECLVDNHRTSVPEQVHFRIEFPRWLSLQTGRNRGIVEMLTLGFSTDEVAHRFKISRGRVSQLRREFDDSWKQFSGERQVTTVTGRDESLYHHYSKGHSNAIARRKTR
jgi:hypothetical protein